MVTAKIEYLVSSNGLGVESVQIKAIAFQRSILLLRNQDTVHYFYRTRR